MMMNNKDSTMEIIHDDLLMETMTALLHHGLQNNN